MGENRISSGVFYKYLMKQDNVFSFVLEMKLFF